MGDHMFLVPAVTCFLTWLFNQTEELELKAEVEKLKLDQALENVRREKARQRQEQRELKELHDGLSGIKNVRDEALDKLKRERQLQATKVLLIQTHRTCVRVHMFFVAAKP